MNHLRLTRQAEQDLQDAWTHVAENNPIAADHLIETLFAAALLLADSPLLGRERPELATGLRSWATTTSWLIFYVPEATGITVIRVLHHARDVASLLP